MSTMRVFRLQSRNPVVGVALLVVLIAIVLAVLAVGLTVLAGAAVLGAVGLLARRALRLRRPPAQRLGATARAGLDPALEVTAPAAAPSHRRLSSGAD